MPYRIHTILINNGIPFAEQPHDRNSAWSRQMHFYIISEANDIEHWLTKPNHPWINGQAESVNRTIKEAPSSASTTRTMTRCGHTSPTSWPPITSPAGPRGSAASLPTNISPNLDVRDRPDHCQSDPPNAETKHLISIAHYVGWTRGPTYAKGGRGEL